MKIEQINKGHCYKCVSACVSDVYLDAYFK